MRSVLVLLFVAVAFFATGEALKCYQCAPSAKACSDTFDKSGTGVTETTCINDRDVCTKTVVELTNKTTVTTRGCDLGVGRANERASSLQIASAKVYYCNNKDLCNGVSTTSVTLCSFIILVMPFIFGRYY